MLILGLTGSIATGKSTVSTFLHSPPYNLPVIDADQIARTATDPTSPTYSQILQHFLPSTPDLLLPPDPDTGHRPINRSVLANKVFGPTPSHKKSLQKLNKIVHPYVRKQIYKSILCHWLKGHWCIVLDIPLLFESGLDVLCGAVILVGIKDVEVQISRLLTRARGEMTREEAIKRIESQMPMEEKCERIGEMGYWSSNRAAVIWNDGGKEELESKLGKVMGRFRNGRGYFWTGLEWVVWPWTVVRVAWVMGGNLWRRWRWLGRRGRREGVGERGKDKDK